MAKIDEIVNQHINEEKAKHFYTSAKSGDNLNEAFKAIVELILEKIGSNPSEKGKTKRTKGLMIGAISSLHRRRCLADAG